MQNANNSIVQPGAADNLCLNYLPGYAGFLIKNYLEEFVALIIKLSREEKVPLLKYFAAFSDADLFALAKKSNSNLLLMLEANTLQQYIDKATGEYINNLMPAIVREDILAEDITLISLVRRRAFRNFLHLYAADQLHFNHVMEDVDRFTAATEVATFNAYINIQQEKIKKINQQLEAQAEQLLEAQQLAGMGSFFWDIKGGANSSYTQSALKIFGLTTPTGLQAFMQDVHPADRERLKAAIDKAFNEDGIFECEYSYIKDGIEKRIWSRGFINFENGKAVSMKGTIMDVTQKYKLLQSLQQSQELYQQAQALTHIGNWSWCIADDEVLWSDEMYRIYGLPPQSEKITFERFMSFLTAADREKRSQEIQQSLQTHQAQDYFIKITAADGKIKMLKGKGEVITDAFNQPQKLNGTCQDVTKEYLLNKELQEKEQNFKQLINNAPDAVIVINAESIITLWNPKTETIFGWTAAEVIDKPLTDTIIPARYKAAHEQGMKRFLDTGEAHILNKTLELTACDKNKNEFYISLTISQTTQAGQTAFIAFVRDISEQKNTQLELQNKTDLLEYKNLELKRINEELESFNFAASHDLQEPLRKIHTYSSRILDKSKQLLPPQVASDFDKIMTAAARMQNLIQDLLQFSQNTLQEQQAEPVNLNAIIEEVKNSFLSDIEEKQVQLNVEQLPVVKVAAFQFLQLFINLLSNAIKYQQPGVSPVITISSTVINSSNINFAGILPATNYLRISVADNGIGFEQEYAEKIFDLFTRLHSRQKYEGTGIGLATCKKIVHNHQGFINAQSSPGKGAAFYIYLPQDCIVSL